MTRQYRRRQAVAPLFVPWLVMLLTLAVAAGPVPARIEAADESSDGDAASSKSFDIVLRQGRIVDGTGAPWYVADVGIRDGLITAIGRIPADAADRAIDASGLVVAPGFVDMMGQTATPMLEDSKAGFNLISQGITTINAGEGVSAAPVDDAESRRVGWRTLGEYFQLVEQAGLPVNLVQTVGHTQVRRIVMGEVDRRPFPQELDRMRQLVRQAMEDGAIGVSTALIYPPAVYATTEEITALAAVAGEYGGRYYTHMRNEGDQLLEAIDEALEIGRAAGTPVHIFHLKTAGRDNWGKMDQAIARIRAARAAGHQVTADLYPYINNGLGIEALVHPRHFVNGFTAFKKSLDDPQTRARIRDEMENERGWENWYRHAGGDWDNIVLGQISATDYAAHAGRSVGEIARQLNRDPWDVFFDIVREGAFALPRSMSEANKIRLMREEFISFCTDVGPAAGSDIAAHPRAFGSFPRLLSHYVRDLGTISLERAVAQASAAAANDVMAHDRGRIAVGLAADVIAFDYEALADRATFAAPHEPSIGMKYVIVNGQLVLDDGKMTDARPGRVLRGPGYAADRAADRVATGKSDERTRAFDEMMAAFLKKHRVPGAALAVTQDGRLVHARGYGYADLAKREPVTPTSLFRIASVSKPITAVAIMQLVEQGKLTLDDKVFDLLQYEPHLAEGATVDPRLHMVTIRQLLQHTGGWDRDLSFDAMFQSVRFAEALGVAPPAQPDHIIRCMLGLPLDFDPGERYAYSNFGYCLLGRVIERLSGQSYEEYVKQRVLAPLGITSMRVGSTRLDISPAPGEVRYYDPNAGRSVFADDLNQPVPHPYGAWYLEAMDAHGGWLASAVDLARFAVALDDPAACLILKPESIAAMFARPAGRPGQDKDGKPADVYYGLGWQVRPIDEQGEKFNAWHTGSLPGTATILVRRHDGKNWVVLMNARQSGGVSHMTREIDPLVHEAADAITDWPTWDLFSEFNVRQTARPSDSIQDAPVR